MLSEMSAAFVDVVERHTTARFECFHVSLCDTTSVNLRSEHEKERLWTEYSNAANSQTAKRARTVLSLRLVAIYGHVTRYGHGGSLLERESERVLTGPQVPLTAWLYEDECNPTPDRPPADPLGLHLQRCRAEVSGLPRVLQLEETRTTERRRLARS
jgi:hypothetical protein